MATLNFWSVFSIVILLWMVMDFWSTHDRFKEMEQELGDLRAQLSEAQSTVTRLTAKAEATVENVRRLRSTLDRANANTKKGNETILMLVNRVHALENRVEELKRYGRSVRNDVDALVQDLGVAPLLTCKTKQERRLKQAYWKLLKQQVAWQNASVNPIDGRTEIVSPPQGIGDGNSDSV